MIRGVLAGMVSGGVLALLLASVASLSVPLPTGHGAGAAAPAEPAVAPTTPMAETPAAVPDAPADSLPAVVPADPAPGAVPVAPAPEVSDEPGQGLAVLPDPAVQGDPSVPGPMAPAPVTEMAALPVAPGPDPALGTAAPSPAPVVPSATPPEAVPSPVPQADAPQAPATMAPAPEAAAAQPDQPAAPGTDAPQAAPAALPTPEPEPEAQPTHAPEPEAQPAPAPQPEPQPQPDPAEAALPQPGFGGAVDGVRTGRLPRIGDAPVEAAPEAEAETAVAVPEDAPALLRNARAFANAEGKPPMAILLLDDPASGVDLAALAAGPVALTLVIDPTAPDAAARAALWRGAGQEVALLADALPARGRDGDYEVAMESLATAFPQALAVVEGAGQPLPTDRAGSSALIAALAARGYGLVTRGGGLNALDQTAGRAGLPAAAIFRALDAEGETAPVIRRYLDRAAFTAQQDGRVIVVGRLRADTVEAIQDWASTSNRAAALALAPVSALVQAAP